MATHDDPAAREKLAASLAEVLKTDVSCAAKDYVCRKLMIIGTAAAVPVAGGAAAAAGLLAHGALCVGADSGAEAAQALRDALPQLDSPLKIGVLSSLGVRQDAASVAAIAALLGDSDAAVARAAAYALGAIQTADAAQALAAAKSSGDDAKVALTDASLTCAEGLLAAGKKADALAIYKRFAGEDQPKHVRLAATRGMLACAGKRE